MATGFGIPSSICFSPDGRLFFLEHVSGNVRVFDKEFHLQIQPVIAVEPTSVDANESGAMGLAFSPDYDAEQGGGYLYASHVLSATQWRISRFWEDGQGNGSNLEPVMDFPDCLVVNSPYGRSHNIGNIHFGPHPFSASAEAVLYVSIGDGGIPNPGEDPNEIHPSQDPTVWCGGMFFIDPDNPPPLEEAEAHRVAYGLRNSYDFCLHPGGGLFMTENGLDTYDEINRLVPSASPEQNFGWPLFEAPGAADGFVPAFLSIGPGTTSPTGICYYDGKELGLGYRGSLFFTEWKTGAIRVLELEGTDLPNFELKSADYLLGSPRFPIPTIQVGHLPLRFTDIEVGPDGFLYLAGGTYPGDYEFGSIVRVSPKELSGISTVRIH